MIQTASTHDATHDATHDRAHARAHATTSSAGADAPASPPPSVGQMSVSLTGDGGAHVVRDTAESEVRITVAMTGRGRARTQFTAADSIDVTGFPALLDTFCAAAGLELDVTFVATTLSSSHVVLEDTGLAMGAGLFALLTEAMQTRGVNGAGSSLQTAEAFATAPVSAAISVEGRKFLKIVSATTWDDLRWRVVMGHTVFGAVRSEDVDDFVDAIAGGMRASLFVHERSPHEDADAFWRETLIALGAALAEVFAANPARRGLPPGVKATLF